MGGVRTDLAGRTSIPRRFAAGEVASNGVHGANRLASNSLLEGVVFGAFAGRAMRDAPPAPPRSREPYRVEEAPTAPEVTEEIRSLAWEKCGIVRDGSGLEEAIGRLEALAEKIPASPEHAVARNMRQVALLIARCALARRESRGAHFRADWPRKRREFARHSVIAKGCEIAFR